MITLKDVAARAGVSVAAVSYCINGTRTLSPDTRARILQAAAELNYIPNAQARNLKSCSSREICVIFPDLESLCYNEFLKGMLMQAEKLNYALTVCCSYNNIRTEQTLIENAISKKCAGLLLVTCQPQNTAFFQDILAHHSIEIVFLDRLPSRMDALYFGFDNYTAVHFLTSQLIQNGYKDIALLSGPQIFFSDSEAAAGYQEALDEASIPFRADRQLSTDTTKEGAFSVFLQSWANDPPQAVITTSQILCQGAIEACNLANLSIPKDICLLTLGVDNWNRSSFYPHIIRSSEPAYSLGAQSCQALIEQMEHSERPESRFHLLQDSITSYPLHFPAPRPSKALVSAHDPSVLRIAAAELPTIHAIEAISHDFYQKYGIRLNLQLFSLYDLFELIQTDSRKSDPDFDLYLFDTSWFSFLYHMDCLKDLTDEIQRSCGNAGYFFPQNLANCSRLGQIYGFPIVGGTQFLLYRRDLFTDPYLMRKYKENHRLSLRPPKTWKEFNSIARFFTREFNPDSPTLYGTAIATELNEELALEFEPRMWGFKGDFFDKNGCLQINSPENQTALSSFVETLRCCRPDTPSNQHVFSEFAKGHLAMIITFTEYAAQIQNSTHSVYLHQSDYSMIPGQIPANVGWHFGLSKNCRKSSEAVSFFQWLYQRHTSYYLSILGSSSALEFPYKNHELQKMYPWLTLTQDSIKNCRSRIYPFKKTNGYLAPHDFERILCDQIRTLPQTPKEISDCLDRIQKQVLHALST